MCTVGAVNSDTLGMVHVRTWDWPTSTSIARGLEINMKRFNQILPGADIGGHQLSDEPPVSDFVPQNEIEAALLANILGDESVGPTLFPLLMNAYLVVPNGLDRHEMLKTKGVSYLGYEHTEFGPLVVAFTSEIRDDERTRKHMPEHRSTAGLRAPEFLSHVAPGFGIHLNPWWAVDLVFPGPILTLYKQDYGIESRGNAADWDGI